jgi:hypothetical protein
VGIQMVIFVKDWVRGVGVGGSSGALGGIKVAQDRVVLIQLVSFCVSAGGVLLRLCWGDCSRRLGGVFLEG